MANVIVVVSLAGPGTIVGAFTDEIKAQDVMRDLEARGLRTQYMVFAPNTPMNVEVVIKPTSESQS